MNTLLSAIKSKKVTGFKVNEFNVCMNLYTLLYTHVGIFSAWLLYLQSKSVLFSRSSAKHVVVFCEFYGFR